MKRVVASLLLLLLLLAQSVAGLGMWRSGADASCAKSHPSTTEHGCCAPDVTCPCEAAPAREEMPDSPALPPPTSRGMDAAMLAVATFVVAEVAFTEPGSVEMEEIAPARLVAPVPRTVLHCSFLI